MNSYELCNDSKFYSITVPSGGTVRDVLLMFEINYNLRMREGAQCGGSSMWWKPLATDEKG